jgi:hypothetical protein
MNTHARPGGAVRTMTRRAFTIEEANALVPLLESVFQTIARTKEDARGHARRLEVLGLLWGNAVADADNPDYLEYIRHRRGYGGAVSEIERLVQDEIVRRGLRFPMGGIEHGLVDFPTTYEGRWVYLCWRIGENALRYWHETDGGYAGRRRITPEQAQRMGREDDPGELDDEALDF